jgi:type IV secretion system protein VirB11
MNYATRSRSPEPQLEAIWEGLSQYLRLAAEPIKHWLQDPKVIEIMCNRPGEIWIEAIGRPHMERFSVPTLTQSAIEGLAQRIAGETHQNVNKETPLLSAAMPHGERFQSVLAPATTSGGAFAIRKQVIQDMSIDDYRLMGGLDAVKVSGPRAVDGDDELTDLETELVEKLRDPMPDARANWLRFAIQNRLTMLISGGTSTGKTTFFNALLKEVPLTERIISIEDTRELKPPQPNYVDLVASRGGQGRAKVTIQELLETALRLRPDRIFMGEIRGAEAFSFLQAVNTGHPGSISTLHADNPRGAYERAAMATMQGGLGLTMSELIAFVRMVVPVVVQLTRDPVTGRRGVAEIYYSKWTAR